MCVLSAICLYFLLPNADKTSVTDGNIVKRTGNITVNLKVNPSVNLSVNLKVNLKGNSISYSSR